ncbi:MAG TPA: hypothetical protein VNC60_10640 [Actinomycetota bacterium]|nr:hypothetical protein [Actinomycetota bacterium]
MLIVYRMGRYPFDHVCRTVWNHSGKPIVCAVCCTPGFDRPEGRSG